MRKILFTFAFVVSFTTIGMSQFHFGAGAQIIFDGTVFGVQGKALYEVDETWRGVGTFTLHLDDFANWTVDLDAQYKLLEISENFNFAPVGGISITDFDIIGSEIGINLGAFFDFVPDDSYRIYVEPKINIGGYESFTLSGGILF